MELSVPTIIIGVILIIVALLLVLVGWGLLIGGIVLGVRAIIHLARSVRAEATYVSDNREAELPDRRSSSPEPVRSRAPRPRRDPRVQEQARRAVARRRKWDRSTSGDRTLGSILLILVLVLGVGMLLGLAALPFASC